MADQIREGDFESSRSDSILMQSPQAQLVTRMDSNMTPMIIPIAEFDTTRMDTMHTPHKDRNLTLTPAPIQSTPRQFYASNTMVKKSKRSLLEKNDAPSYEPSMTMASSAQKSQSFKSQKMKLSEDIFGTSASHQERRKSSLTSKVTQNPNNTFVRKRTSHFQVERGQQFTAKLQHLAEMVNGWFQRLNKEDQRVHLWQQDRFEQEDDFRDQIITDITESFQMVDFDGDGVINNIEFFVMQRELDERWHKVGILRHPMTDHDMMSLFEVYNDYNVSNNGITLDEVLECRNAIVNRVKILRSQANATSSTVNTLFPGLE